MSQDKYPLIKAMGLDIYEIRGTASYDGVYYDGVYADELEAKLREAPVVYGRKNYGEYNTNSVTSDDTHTARLVCIQPIQKDTAESLLRDLVSYIDKEGPAAKEWRAITDLVDRVRTLLGEKK